MTFLEHLEDLRVRLRRAAIGYVLCVIVAYQLSDWIFVMLAQPLVDAWRAAGLGQPVLNFKSPTEPLFVYIRVSLLGGFFLASPYIFLQLWRFVAPGLFKRERNVVLGLVVGSAACFVGGALFGYFVAFPALFKFLLKYATNSLEWMRHLLPGIHVDPVKLNPVIMMEEYLGLITTTLLGFGACFELPVLMVFFGWIGLVSYKTFLRVGRYAVVVIFVVAGIVTPDPTMASQVLLAVPLVGLYYLGVLLVYIVGGGAARLEDVT